MRASMLSGLFLMAILPSKAFSQAGTERDAALTELLTISMRLNAARQAGAMNMVDDGWADIDPIASDQELNAAWGQFNALDYTAAPNDPRYRWIYEAGGPLILPFYRTAPVKRLKLRLSTTGF